MRANKHAFKQTCHFELKQTTTDYISFNCVEPQQINYGDAIQKGDGIVMRNLGGNGEPDYSFLYKDPVYVTIRYPHFFCLIPLHTFYREKRESDRKSLTSARAREISFLVVEL